MCLSFIIRKCVQLMTIIFTFLLLTASTQTHHKATISILFFYFASSFFMCAACEVLSNLKKHIRCAVRYRIHLFFSLTLAFMDSDTWENDNRMKRKNIKLSTDTFHVVCERCKEVYDYNCSSPSLFCKLSFIFINKLIFFLFLLKRKMKNHLQIKIILRLFRQNKTRIKVKKFFLWTVEVQFFEKNHSHMHSSGKAQKKVYTISQDVNFLSWLNFMFDSWARNNILHENFSWHYRWLSMSLNFTTPATAICASSAKGKSNVIKWHQNGARKKSFIHPYILQCARHISSFVFLTSAYELLHANE